MSSIALRNFTAGELSPELYSRTDLAKYAAGARTVRNFLVKRQGGLDNRPGTELVRNFAGYDVIRLLPFVFNDSQTYVLMFSYLQLQFIRNGAMVGAPYSIVTPYAVGDLAGLQITQSADVVTIVHPSYAVYELARIADTNWTLTAVTFGPGIAAPTGLTATPSQSTGLWSWAVTAVNASGQESYMSTPLSTRVVLTTTFSLSWTAVTGAVSYNLYRQDGAGPYGLIFGIPVGVNVGVGGTPAQVPNTDINPPNTRVVFNASGDYPAAVGQYQQRQIYGGSNNQPETVYTSRSADRKNFTVSTPVQDDDAVTFTIVARKVSAVRHFVDAGYFLIFTSGGEYIIDGDAAGVIRPTDVNVRRLSAHGASQLPPIDMGGRLLFGQARQTTIRDLSRDQYGRVQGTDMTIYASHLFNGYTLKEWAYAETPNSIIWVIRSDGTLLGLTDVADQEVMGWHHHDTAGGLFESVCVVPEGGEDRVYVVVNRGGNRMIERFASRFFTDVKDAILTDSTLSYDGRNTTGHTMTLTGSGWTYSDLLTCTASVATFASGDVGTKAVFVTTPDGTVIHFRITGYTSTTVVTGFPDKTVPAGAQGVALTTWALAVNTVGGLTHLIGKSLSVVGDGFVVASPNNPAVSQTCVVDGGGITTLGGYYAYIHAGLPVTADLLTLDLDSPSGPTLRDKKQIITKVMAEVVASRSIFAGGDTPTDGLTTGLSEIPLRDQEGWNDPVSLKTGVVRVNIDNNWERNGRVAIRQVDPLPLSIGAVMPVGFIPQGSP